MGKLDGRVALLTGARRDTTQVMASLLVDEGARVVLVDHPDAPKDEGAMGDHFGDAARRVLFDLGDEAAWTDAIGDVRENEGRLDVVVTNAAQVFQNLIADTTVDDILHMLRYNFISAFLAVKSSAPLMRDSGGGSMVLLSSLTTVTQGLMTSAYGASRWATRGFAKTAALELGRDGIRVNMVVGPNVDFGPTWTPDHPFGNRPSTMKEGVRHYPLGGYGRPDVAGHLARAVLFLASDDSAYTSGVDLVVDGGSSAGRYESIPGHFELGR